MPLKKKPAVETVEIPEDITPVDPVRDEGTSTSATAERLGLALSLVSRKFNLDETYRVTKFNDKGKVVELTLDGPDFICAVTIKDSEMHGMYIPPVRAE